MVIRFDSYVYDTLTNEWEVVPLAIDHDIIESMQLVPVPRAAKRLPPPALLQCRVVTTSGHEHYLKGDYGVLVNIWEDAALHAAQDE